MEGEVFGIAEAVEAEGMDLLYRAGEVGVNLKRFTSQTTSGGCFSGASSIEIELCIGRIEMLVLALVFPSAAAAHSDASPILAATDVADTMFEVVRRTIRVGRGGVARGRCRRVAGSQVDHLREQSSWVQSPGLPTARRRKVDVPIRVGWAGNA